MKFNEVNLTLIKFILCADRSKLLAVPLAQHVNTTVQPSLISLLKHSKLLCGITPCMTLILSGIICLMLMGNKK